MANFTVKHGGLSRFSAKVASSESTNWTKGRLLTINSSNQIAVFSNSSTANHQPCGVAMENRIASTSVGPTVTLTRTGAPTGDRYSMILDAAVIVTDAMESGVSFNGGDLLYASTNGKITTSGNSTGPNNPRIGVALSDGASNDSLRPLTMFFQVSY